MFDINEVEALKQEVVSYDPDAELNPAFFVPDGTYLVELALGGQNGITYSKDKSKKPFIEAWVNGKIIAPGTKYDGSTVSGPVKSMIFPNSNTSLLHQLLKSAQAPAPASTSLGDLEQRLANLLASKPQIAARTRLEAYLKDETGSQVE